MKKEKRYSVVLMNRNGYTIRNESTSVEGCKQVIKRYPLSVFFGWIYDKKTDTMLYQNDYSNKWKKCNNETFVPYGC